jgi:hypothetical protein
VGFLLKRGTPRFRTFWWGEAKFCPHCPDGGEWWPLECFYPHPQGQGGLDNRCGACRLEYRKRLEAR